MLTNYNIGIWGFGSHAKKRILPELINDDNIHLVGIYSSDSIKNQYIEKKLKLKTWNNENDFLNDASINIVYLATPNGSHYEHGKKILLSNKHLICEKSITCNYSHTIDLINIAQKYQLFLYEAFMYKLHQQYEVFLNELKAIGSIRYSCNTFTLPKLENYGFRKNLKLGGGILWDVACYPVSLIIDLPNFNLSNCKLNFAHFEYERDIDIFLKVILTSNQQMHDIIVSYDHVYANSVLVSGENGSIFAENIFSKNSNLETSIIISDINNRKRELKIEKDNYYKNMFKHIYKSISNRTEREINYKIIRQQGKLMEIISK